MTQCMAYFRDVSEADVRPPLASSGTVRQTTVGCFVDNDISSVFDGYLLGNVKDKASIIICIMQSMAGCMDSGKRFFCIRVRIGHSRSSKVDQFDTNRKRICNFYSNLGAISHRFRDTANYWLKMLFFLSHFH